MFPHLFVYDGSCNGKQRDFHLSAGHGKGGCFNNSFYDSRNYFWRIFAGPYATDYGAGRAFVVVSGCRYFDICDCSFLYRSDTQGVEREGGEVDFFESGVVRFFHFIAGTGTLEEIAEVMFKVSLKHLNAPCILYNLDGYYNHLKVLLIVIIVKAFLK